MRWSGAAWREATERALYGDGGFFRRPATDPAAHFRTSVHASPVFAEAVLALARDAGLSTVVDVGAGGGELLVALHDLDPTLQLVGVELADRPAGLAADIAWTDRRPRRASTRCSSRTSGSTTCRSTSSRSPTTGWRLVLVDPATGDETARRRRRTTPTATGWTAGGRRGEVGDRAEVGRPRDEAWAAAVAVTAPRRSRWPSTTRTDRDNRPPGGTLTGYRGGRQVPPVPDGSCDITSHVALDACAAAGHGAGATDTLLTTQRTALHALGVRRSMPPHELSRTDPAGYLRELSPRRRGGRAHRPGRPRRLRLAGAGRRRRGCLSS